MSNGSIDFFNCIIRTSAEMAGPRRLPIIPQSPPIIWYLPIANQLVWLACFILAKGCFHVCYPQSKLDCSKVYYTTIFSFSKNPFFYTIITSFLVIILLTFLHGSKFKNILSIRKRS